MNPPAETRPVDSGNAALAAQLSAFAHAITAIAAPQDTAALFRPTPQGGPPRLGVYRHAYRARLTDALRENYPVLHRVLGDEDFDAMARGYLDAHPSRHPSIRWFGHALAEHLQTLADAGTLHHPALPDLARMEWALGAAFDAADTPPLRTEHLTMLPADDWPALRFTAHPSLRLTTLQWAVEPLWRTLGENPDAEATPPAFHPHHLLTWREGGTDGRTQWRSADAIEAALLRAALAGNCFSDLCEQAASMHGDNEFADKAAGAAAAVAGYLRQWVETGMLSSPDVNLRGPADPSGLPPRAHRG